ncbi:hypothetical protein ACP8Y2_14700 [Herpetosiphon llansteffanensis]
MRWLLLKQIIHLYFSGSICQLAQATLLPTHANWLLNAFWCATRQFFS